MVASTTEIQNGVSSSTSGGSAAARSASPHALSNGAAPVAANGSAATAPLAGTTLPKGKYTVVGIDIDTTGRRLIDEIVQLAAYTPREHFEQYIMPYMNLNPAARQRHQVRVISIGFYRMLKSMQTYKIIKSKSEIAALKDFLDWLEALKAKDASSLGVVLVYHEERKFIPYMILESLKKYNLLDRFLSTVKAFANGLSLAKANANEALQHYTLRKLSKVLSAKVHDITTAAEGDDATATTTTVTIAAADSTQSKSNNEPNGEQQQRPPQQHQQQSQLQPHELFDGNASVRAQLAYEVALQLSNLENGEEPLEGSAALEKLLTALRPYAQPIDNDINELHTQNENLERQNSFRPVFLNYFKTTLYHRVRAVKFRIILAEHCYDLQTLNAIWSEKQREGLEEVLHVIEELKAEDKVELADLFDSYFDPAKTTIRPIVKNNNRRRNRRAIRNNIHINDGRTTARSLGSEQGAGGDKQGAAAGQLPDSTTKSPTQQLNNNNNNDNVLNGGGGFVKGQQQRPNKPRQRGERNSLKTQAINDIASSTAVSPTIPSSTTVVAN